MNKFQELVDLCKGDVIVWANDHRSNYESIEEYVGDERENIGEEVWNKIIESQRVYRIQAYVFTQIGFHLVFHYDFDLAIEETLSLVKEDIAKTAKSR